MHCQVYDRFQKGLQTGNQARPENRIAGTGADAGPHWDAQRFIRQIIRFLTMLLLTSQFVDCLGYRDISYSFGRRIDGCHGRKYNNQKYDC